MPVRRPRVLVTRSPRQASALADGLRDLGAEPILIPTIETVEPTSFTALDESLKHLENFHWLIFTSSNAVEAFSLRLQTLKGTGFNPTQAEALGLKGTGFNPAQAEVLALKGTGFSPYVPAQPQNGASASEGTRPQIAAIGPSTAQALRQIGFTPDLLPPQAVAESLTEALRPHARQPDGSPTRFLLIRAEEAREYLPDTLRAAGAEVTVAPAYRTVIPEGAAERIRHVLTTEQVDAITFTSSSTARNLFTLLEAGGITLPISVIRASIGPITSSTLTDLGHPPHVEAPEATVRFLAETLVKYLNASKTA